MKRALEAWPEIDFIDDREGCLFTATVHRKIIEGAGIGPVNADGSPKSSSKSSPKSAVIGSVIGSEKILIMLKAEPELAAKEIAKRLEISPRAVEKQISKLWKKCAILSFSRRVGHRIDAMADPNRAGTERCGGCETA